MKTVSFLMQKYMSAADERAVQERVQETMLQLNGTGRATMTGPVAGSGSPYTVDVRAGTDIRKVEKALRKIPGIANVFR